jgi:hypothetical protein
MFIFNDGQTRVMFGSATNPESLESATAKGAWLDEAGQAQFRLESLEAIDRRLSLFQGRKFITSTPYNLGTLYTHVYKPAREGDPNVRVIQFPSSLNPAFPHQEMERQRDNLPAWKYRMFYEGRFDKPPSLIYGEAYEDEYREQGGNLIKPFPIPQWWPRYGGFDFGGVHLATVLAAFDPVANVYYLYSERLAGGMTAAHHTRDLLLGLGGAPLHRSWGGAGSEDNWRMEFTAAGLMIEKPEVNDVEVGIDRVIGLLKNRRLFVFDTCKGLRAELGSYSRKVDAEGNPTPEIEDKNKFHLCLIAGTLVQTQRGEIPIERVRVGDLARTRAGYRLVSAAGCINPDAETWRVELSDGTTVQGTGDHPAWTANRGWVPFRELTACDTLLWCRSPRASCSRAFATTVGRVRRIEPRASTSTRRNWAARRCTSRSTRLLTGRFRRTGTFTTEMRTRSITTQLISRLSHLVSTCAGITPAESQNGAWSIWRGFGRWPPPGIAPTPAEPGMASTADGRGLGVKSAATSASNAGRSSRRSSPRGPGSVGTTAKLCGGSEAVSMTSSGSVSSAVLASRSTSTSRRRPAVNAAPRRSRLLNVRRVRAMPRQAVFNLTVEGEHEYFANGVLVSNCDAVRYLSVGIGGPPMPAPVLSFGSAAGGWSRGR